jgi:hypothetical protein
MQFRPLHDRVLVRRIEAKEKFGDMCALIERSTVKVVPHDQVSGGAARSPAKPDPEDHCWPHRVGWPRVN